MWLTKLFTAATVLLTGLLPSSCTRAKNPAAHSAPTAAQVAVDLKNKDLGELQLTNHYETSIQLGAGKSCTFTPLLLDRSDLQMTMSLESKKADGKIAGLSVVQVVGRTGKSFEVAVGDMNLTFTPEITDE